MRKFLGFFSIIVMFIDLEYSRKKNNKKKNNKHHHHHNHDQALEQNRIEMEISMFFARRKKSNIIPLCYVNHG